MPALFDLLAELFDLGGLLVALAQLALDGLELLAQEVLALHLVDLGAGLVLDLLADLQHFHFARQDADQPVQLVGGRVHLQQRLGFLQVHALEIGDGIDRLQRIFDRNHRGHQLARDGRDHLGDVLELVAGIARQGFQLQALFDRLGASAISAFRYGSSWMKFDQAAAQQALDHQADGAIRGAEHAVDHRHRADGEQVLRGRAFPAPGCARSPGRSGARRRP